MNAGVDVDGFLHRFTRFGAAPSRDTYLALFHSDATLLDAGMEHPLTVAEIPAHIEGILSLVPDFRMIPERWRASGPTLFVEAFNQATLGGSVLGWRSIYRVELRADRVVRGQRYYDRAPLFARLDPNLPAPPPIAVVAEPERTLSAAVERSAADLVRACVDAWGRGAPEELADLYREDSTLVTPGRPRPLGRGEIGPYYRALAATVSELRLELQAWAADEALLFIAWRATGTLGGQPFTLASADRFDLVRGQILSARTYFDTLTLATLAASQGPASATVQQALA